MTESDIAALGREMTERLRDIACICPEPGCHFCAPPDVYWPTFRAALRSMTSAKNAEYLRADRAKRRAADDRLRARRRDYARHRSAVVRLDSWEPSARQTGRRRTDRVAV